MGELFLYIVRDTHVAYGNAASRPLGSNWAEVIGETYTLRHPQDLQGPPKERIGCRCVLVPV